MSISVLNRGGTSGGLKPELTVAAPSGSTIDLLQNGIIVATYTLGANETEHTFVVKVGSYTVRASGEGKADEKSVVVDRVGRYNVSLEYMLWLYREGDECEDVTGGWALENGGGGSLTKNADHMVLYYNSNTSAVYTKNTAMLNPKYRTFCAEVKAEQSSFSQKNFVTQYSSNSSLYSEIASTSYYKQTIDVSAMIGAPFYVRFYGQYYTSPGNGRIYIKNVWLE